MQEFWLVLDHASMATDGDGVGPAFLHLEDAKESLADADTTFEEQPDGTVNVVLFGNSGEPSHTIYKVSVGLPVAVPRRLAALADGNGWTADALRGLFGIDYDQEKGGTFAVVQFAIMKGDDAGWIEEAVSQPPK